MKQSLTLPSGILLILLLVIFHVTYGLSQLEFQSGIISDKVFQDTSLFKTVTGKVIDSKSAEPIVFATVFIAGTKAGTVTNSDGEFILKIPSSMKTPEIGIAHIGYKTSLINLSSLKSSGNRIALESAPYPIREVVIRDEDPIELMKKALAKIPENYSGFPVMMTSFYRETIHQNRSYVAVAEAVLDAYKSSYTSVSDYDRVKVFKGRKSQDVKKMDTILFKFQGGPYTSFLLDLAKNPGELLDPEAFKFYDYSMEGIISMNDELAYVIEFDQKELIDFPLYKGRLYLGYDNLAIMGAEFEISPKEIERASEYLIRKKPLGMNVEVLSGNYLVKYRQIDNFWYLNYVRTELNFKVKWDRKLFSSTYTTMSEMAVTDIGSENIEKFKYKETTKLTDIFVEKVEDFEDPDFWGDYNIIKPDESIEAAIERLSRKLKRRTE